MIDRYFRSDEVGFLHPTQFCSLQVEDDDSNSQHPEPHHTRYLWCRDHKLAISAEILPRLYRAARDAYCNARVAPLSPTHLLRHTKALLILCPDLLTAWNSRYAHAVSYHSQYVCLTKRSIDEYCNLHAPREEIPSPNSSLFFPAGRWCYQQSMVSQSSRMSCNCVP